MILDTIHGRPAPIRRVVARIDGCALACYYFDLHADGPAQWDHGGIHCVDRAEIEHRAREMLTAAVLRRDANGMRATTITLCVHEGTSGVVLTALAKPGVEMELVWA